MNYTKTAPDGSEIPIGLQYAILPIDEEVFEINANTRQISIPENFRKNGIAVQGDQVAEVVYFKIARYFDFMDLNNTMIYIQYETPDGTQDASFEWVRDIESEPDYLIFGWALDSRITAASGLLKFSIRFVNLDNPQDSELPDNIKYTYSLNTLQASVNIQPTLVMENDINHDAVAKGMEKIKHMIISRVKQAEIVGGEEAEAPEVTMMIEDWIKEDGIANQKSGEMYVIDLVYQGPDNNNKPVYAIKPRIQAFSVDTGVISYNWNEIPTIGLPHPVDVRNDSYRRTTDDIPEPSTIYYKRNKNTDSTYTYTMVTGLGSTDTIPFETTSDGYITDEAGNRLKLNKEDGKYYIYDKETDTLGEVSTPIKAYFEKYGESTIVKAGTYEGLASNTLSSGKSSTVSCGKILVPGPEAAETIFEETAGFFAGDNNEYTIQATIKNNSIFNDGDFITQSAGCAYQWFKDNEAYTTAPIQISKEDLQIVNAENNKKETVAKISLKIEAGAEKLQAKQGDYSLKITSSRNNAKHEDATVPVSITYKPTELKSENIKIVSKSTGNTYIDNSDTLEAQVSGLDNQIKEKTKLTYKWFLSANPHNTGAATQTLVVVEGNSTIDLSEHWSSVNSALAINPYIRCEVLNNYNGMDAENGYVASQYESVYTS